MPNVALFQKGRVHHVFWCWPLECGACRWPNGAPTKGTSTCFVTGPLMFNIERDTKSIHSWVESMAQNVSLTWTSCQPHHSNGYAIGPYQASKCAPNPDQQGIQFGPLTLDGPSIFGECTHHDWSCAISYQAVGYFCWRFPLATLGLN